MSVSIFKTLNYSYIKYETCADSILGFLYPNISKYNNQNDFELEL